MVLDSNASENPDCAELGRVILGFLRRRLIGFPDDCLQVILATSFAAGAPATGGRNLLALAPTGVGKSTVFRLVAQLLRYSFVAYDMSKDDLLSIAGVMNLTQMRAGDQLEWLRHPRTIEKFTAVLADEINRCPRAEAAILFEAMESREMFSMPLQCRVFMAAANPTELNSGANRIDEAHIDRFDVVLETPRAEELSKVQLAAVAQVNLRSATKPRNEEESVPDATVFRDQMVHVRESLFQDVALTGAVTNWCGSVVWELLRPTVDNRRYISFRTIGKMVNVALDVLAFENTLNPKGFCESFVDRVEMSARFSLQLKCRIDPADFSKALGTARPLLRNYQEWRLRRQDRLIGLALGSLAQRVAAAESLAELPLKTEERIRCQSLLSQLVTDVTEKFDYNPALVSRLWHACLNLSQLEEAHTAELSVFRHRMKHLLAADHACAARGIRDSAWAPDQIWT